MAINILEFVFGQDASVLMDELVANAGFPPGGTTNAITPIVQHQTESMWWFNRGDVEANSGLGTVDNIAAMDDEVALNADCTANSFVDRQAMVDAGYLPAPPEM